MKMPYLIQRCSLSGAEFNKNIMTGQYFKLDYMGSSEFEFGAIPKFQRAIAEKIDSMKLIEVVMGQGQTIYALVDKGAEKDYTIFLRSKIIKGAEHEYRTKELTYIREALFEPKHHAHKTCFWMDIDNNFVFAKDKEVLMNFKTTVRNSVRFMNQQAG